MVGFTNKLSSGMSALGEGETEKNGKDQIENPATAGPYITGNFQSFSWFLHYITFVIVKICKYK